MFLKNIIDNISEIILSELREITIASNSGKYNCLHLGKSTFQNFRKYNQQSYWKRRRGAVRRCRGSLSQKPVSRHCLCRRHPLAGHVGWTRRRVPALRRQGWPILRAWAASPEAPASPSKLRRTNSLGWWKHHPPIHLYRIFGVDAFFKWPHGFRAEQKNWDGKSRLPISPAGMDALHFIATAQIGHLCRIDRIEAIVCLINWVFYEVGVTQTRRLSSTMLAHSVESPCCICVAHQQSGRYQKGWLSKCISETEKETVTSSGQGDQMPERGAAVLCIILDQLRATAHIPTGATSWAPTQRMDTVATPRGLPHRRKHCTLEDSMLQWNVLEETSSNIHIAFRITFIYAKGLLRRVLFDKYAPSSTDLQIQSAVHGLSAAWDVSFIHSFRYVYKHTYLFKNHKQHI